MNYFYAPKVLQLHMRPEVVATMSFTFGEMRVESDTETNTYVTMQGTHC
jgi:hypothetical protein